MDACTVCIATIMHNHRGNLPTTPRTLTISLALGLRPPYLARNCASWSMVLWDGDGLALWADLLL